MAAAVGDNVLPAARAVSEVSDEALVAWAEKLLLQVLPDPSYPPLNDRSLSSSPICNWVNRLDELSTVTAAIA
jgi:hypothetical protein